MGLSQKILVNSENIDKTNEPVYNNLEDNRKVILSESKKLDNERIKLLKLKKEHETLIGKYNENVIDISSKYYRYMAYTIGAATLGSIAFYKMVSS
jgi:hypothetical protein